MAPGLLDALKQLDTVLQGLALGSDQALQVAPAVARVRDAAQAEGQQAVQAQSKTIWQLAGRLWVRIHCSLPVGLLQGRC